jgi:hypothetical protein
MRRLLSSLKPASPAPRQAEGSMAASPDSTPSTEDDAGLRAACGEAAAIVSSKEDEPTAYFPCQSYTSNATPPIQAAAPPDYQELVKRLRSSWMATEAFDNSHCAEYAQTIRQAVDAIECLTRENEGLKKYVDLDTDALLRENEAMREALNLAYQIITEDNLNAPYCELCDSHAPKDNDGALIGFVRHEQDCPLMQIDRLRALSQRQGGKRIVP